MFVDLLTKYRHTFGRIFGAQHAGIAQFYEIFIAQFYRHIVSAMYETVVNPLNFVCMVYIKLPFGICSCLAGSAVLRYFERQDRRQIILYTVKINPGGSAQFGIFAFEAVFIAKPFEQFRFEGFEPQLGYRKKLLTEFRSNDFLLLSKM